MQLEQIICQARKACRLVNDLCRITLSAEEIAGIFEQLTEILPPLNEVVGAVTGTQATLADRSLWLFSTASREPWPSLKRTLRYFLLESLEKFGYNIIVQMITGGTICHDSHSVSLMAA